MVFGFRMTGHPLQGGMPLYKFLGNKVLTILENWALGMQLSEYHSGFRAYSCEALQQVPFEKCTDQFHFDTQVLIQFMQKGLRMKEIPIPTHYGPESHQVGFWASVHYAGLESSSVCSSIACTHQAFGGSVHRNSAGSPDLTGFGHWSGALPAGCRISDDVSFLARLVR